MRLALLMFDYFPHGGLQRDFFRVASAAVQAGHQVLCCVGGWRGPRPAGVEVLELGRAGCTNHARDADFVRRAAVVLAGVQVDCRLGFQKMPGLDVYFAGDDCQAARAGGWRRLLAWLPRQRHQLAMERAVFGADQTTRILLLTRRQQAAYAQCYPAAMARCQLLPPAAPPALPAGPVAVAARLALRQAQACGERELVLLVVASNFWLKGLDRALLALQQLPSALRQRCRLWVVGGDDPRPFLRLARRRGLASQLQFFGATEQPQPFYLAADVLLHLARREAAGHVLLEALAAGLPVLTTSICGYAEQVERLAGGTVLVEPWSLAAATLALQQLLVASRESSPASAVDQPLRAGWRELGAAVLAQLQAWEVR